ncbi:MAG: 2-dehydro-3-deoxy-D-gluconate 5-dehydrogenase [Anaerolineales bacterium]|nr:2-dehydro-3-deoxy-D-gluconate 5-dehydrogenase [Anaerolineales bacterium]
MLRPAQQCETQWNQFSRSEARLRAERSRIIDAAIDAFGHVDVLINSAAIFEAGDFMRTDEANWDRHFDINLKAPFLLSQAFAKQIPEEDRASKIINITDWRGLRPGTDHVAYTLTKSALLTLTEIMAQALAPRITVNALALGAILPPPGADEGYMDRLAKTIPMRRTGSPADAVAAMMMLLEGSEFITGTTVVIDGGEHLD